MGWARLTTDSQLLKGVPKIWGTIPSGVPLNSTIDISAAHYVSGVETAGSEGRRCLGPRQAGQHRP